MTHSQKQTEFLKLYQPVHDRLARFVHSMVWNKEEARDLVSETLAVAFEKFSELRSQDAFLQFLFGIASNLIRQQIRKKYKKGEWNEEEASLIADSGNAEGSLLLDELNRALQRISPEAREAIVLYEISGVEMAEIARLQNCEESTVRSRISRGRQQLAKILEHPKENHYAKQDR